MLEIEEGFLSDLGVAQPETSWRSRISKSLISILLASLLIPISAFVTIPAANAVTATNLSVFQVAEGSASGQAFTTQPILILYGTGSVAATGQGGTVLATANLGAVLVGSTTAEIDQLTGKATFTNLGISGTAGTAYTIFVN